ncbi:hypothetical protein PHYBOEH_003168 [Phytophthora boehmeriae]|uniref:Uncharacterized protein n=1 Tax=Phytophthora boehmeriae TaxID=109152 RepID=A0A8T1WRE6_9STRA|nr:hypothetical protein PHYBOEH_003168 [Phytophthora boehmeriae]
MEDTTPHVLLYFDVNKTLIMHDPVQGKALVHILNDLLTERAYGRVVKGQDGATEWLWDGQKALKERAEPIEADLTSYGAFLRAKFPLSSDPKTAKQHKHKRKVLRQDFTALGNPGEGLEDEHRELLQHLLLPRTTASEAQMEEVGLAESPHCFVVPAFFRLLQHLQEQKVKFNLIFRTFGDDLHRVAQEFNSFCEGRHPCFPLATPMDGSAGGVDRRIHLQGRSEEETPRFGTFLRTESTTALIMGTFRQPKTADHADSLAFYAPYADSIRIVRGLPEVHAFLARRWRESQATLALRDFYPYWFQNNEVATAGKLLTLGSEDEAENVHAMFFDDNILPHDAHIVDARLAESDTAVPFEETQELHLLRVEPLDVIQSETYLIDRFEASLEQWKARKG